MSGRPAAVAWFHDKFAPFVGAQQLEIGQGEGEPGEFVVRLAQAQPWQRGGGGTDALNGGVVAYMFDGALGGACAVAALERYEVAEADYDRFGQVTVTLTINYLEAARGDSFEARGRVTKLGRSTAFAEGRLYDEQGTVCATASGVWKLYLPRS